MFADLVIASAHTLAPKLGVLILLGLTTSLDYPTQKFSWTLRWWIFEFGTGRGNSIEFDASYQRRTCLTCYTNQSSLKSPLTFNCLSYNNLVIYNIFEFEFYNELFLILFNILVWKRNVFFVTKINKYRVKIYLNGKL